MTGRPELNWPTVMYTEEVIREGFGIESVHIPVQAKVDLIHALSDTGLKRMTVGAFVSPRFVPQMACFEELLSRFTPRQGVSYLTFVHNQRARQKAQQFAPPLTIEAEMCHLSLDICDVHQMRNVNRTKQEIIATWPALISQARQQGIRQGRVAIYSAWGSNFMGKFSQAQRLLELTRQIEMLQAADIEVVEIGLHDSQSWCLPHEMEADLQEIKRRWPDVHHFHLHMHDARGMALPALYAALRTLAPTDTLWVDGALGGIAGGQYCGNGVASAMVPTEDFMHMLEGMGIDTGVDLHKLIDCVWMLEDIIGHPSFGRVSKAGPRPTQKQALYDPNLPAIETLQAARHFQLGPQAYEGKTYFPWAQPIPDMGMR